MLQVTMLPTYSFFAYTMALSLMGVVLSLGDCRE